MSDLVKIGRHAYIECGYCHKMVRVTGLFACLHLCVSPEQRRAIDDIKDIARQQLHHNKLGSFNIDDLYKNQKQSGE